MTTLKTLVLHPTVFDDTACAVNSNASFLKFIPKMRVYQCSTRRVGISETLQERAQRIAWRKPFGLQKLECVRKAFKSLDAPLGFRSNVMTIPMSLLEPRLSDRLGFASILLTPFCIVFDAILDRCRVALGSVLGPKIHQNRKKRC